MLSWDGPENKSCPRTQVLQDCGWWVPKEAAMELDQRRGPTGWSFSPSVRIKNDIHGMLLPSKVSAGPWAYAIRKLVMQPTGSPSERKPPLLLSCCLSMHAFPRESGVSACSPEQSPEWVITFRRHTLPWQRVAVSGAARSKLLHGPAMCQGVVLVPRDSCTSWLEEATAGYLLCAEQPVLDRIWYLNAKWSLCCGVKPLSSNILNFRTV